MNCKESIMIRRQLTVAAVVVMTVILLSIQLGAADFSSRKTIESNDGGMVFLSELGAVITESDDGLLVEMVLPVEQRDSEYQDVDLQQNDLVLMLNGKRMKSIQILQDGYEALSTGEMAKLGIKRDGQMMIVSFPKSETDPEKKPRMMVMTMEVDDSAGGAEPRIELTTPDGKTTASAALVDLGVMLDDQEGDPTIIAVLPNLVAALSETEIEVGDIIRSLQGEEVASGAELSDRYESVAVGDTVRLLVDRDGAEVEISFIKPEPQRGMIIKHRKEMD